MVTVPAVRKAAEATVHIQGILSSVGGLLEGALPWGVDEGSQNSSRAIVVGRDRARTRNLQDDVETREEFSQRCLPTCSAAGLFRRSKPCKARRDSSLRTERPRNEALCTRRNWGDAEGSLGAVSYSGGDCCVHGAALWGNCVVCCGNLTRPRQTKNHSAGLMSLVLSGVPQLGIPRLQSRRLPFQSFRNSRSGWTHTVNDAAIG